VAVLRGVYTVAPFTWVGPVGLLGVEAALDPAWGV
jgi:hypothetical protein